MAFTALPDRIVRAQTNLPEVQIKQPESAPARPKGKPKRRAKPTEANRAAVKVAPTPSGGAASQTGATGSAAAAGAPTIAAAAGGGAPAPANSTFQNFNAIQNTILPPTGVNVSSKSQAQIQAQPLGDNTPIEKTLLQVPGFSQDSAASGALHLRNDHANVQYRIDGVILPDGVSGFGQLLDSGFIGNLEVLDGALPAQYGLHNTGIVDITSRSSAYQGGYVSLMGGSQGTIEPSFQYGGAVGQTNYFVAASGLSTNEGIENADSSYYPIHDHSYQGRFFGDATTYLGDGSRINIISGVSVGTYEIPNNPGQPIQYTVPGAVPIASSQLNETQYEQNYYNVLTWQKSLPTVDFQISAFSRFSNLNFVPDQLGDLEFNGVASDVYRSSFVNGLQGDSAWKVTRDHTLHFGFVGSGEVAQADNISTVFPLDANGDVTGPPFVATPTTNDFKVGWLAGVYAEDEWRLNTQLTVNTGLRFDQMWGYVDANQWSPRINFVWKPLPATTVHGGYARYFTPPELSLSAPINIAAYNGTSQQPAVPLDDPVQPERSNVFDLGVDQQLSPALSAGLDSYYKKATDLIDDGQFGAANTLTAFNYAKGWNVGVEGKVKYEHDNLTLYGNLAWGRQYATDVVSNQFLFSDPVEFAYIQTHWIPTDHSQTWTGSAGANYRWNSWLFSTDMIVGSGLRSGFANLSTVPAYAQFNLGVSKSFKWSPNEKPLTVRVSMVNLFDSVYVIRNGTGIGVFAPQYGPRFGAYLTLSQAL